MEFEVHIFNFTSSDISRSGVFWLFWDLLLFLSSFSAILLGNVIAWKNKSFTKSTWTFSKVRFLHSQKSVCWLQFHRLLHFQKSACWRSWTISKVRLLHSQKSACCRGWTACYILKSQLADAVDILKSPPATFSKVRLLTQSYILKRSLVTGRRRHTGCLVLTGHFPQKRQIVSGSLVERDFNWRHPLHLRHPVLSFL